MNLKYQMPLEQTSKEEAEKQRIAWNKGPYNFLLNRTKEKYNHKSNKDRRNQIIKDLNTTLPEINDPFLLDLYMYACTKYQKSCCLKYDGNSGFFKTKSESTFLKTIETVIKNNPKLKHLEVYPSNDHSKDLPSNFKMVIGNIVPDFIVFGLTIKKSSSIAIEINGDSHIQKWSKDETRNNHLKELRVFSFEIPNQQVEDYDYITKSLLSMYRLRNGSFNKQIKRAKRLIWTKTIACHLSLDEIESYILNKYSIQLNLKEEANYLLKLKTCPKIIKKEIKLLSTVFR